jgi:DedD protein
MASPPSPEASEIRRRGRQRLIGAIAIAVALVVFVPMILDSEPRPARNEPALEIPAKEHAPLLPPPAPAAPSKVQPVIAPEPSKLQSAPRKQAATAPKREAAPKLEGFAVQVGAFREEAKLKQARDKLTAAGITHYIERLGAQPGELTRLRAGPYPTREGAEKALAAVKAAALDGQVVPLP